VSQLYEIVGIFLNKYAARCAALQLAFNDEIVQVQCLLENIGKLHRIIARVP